MEPQQTFQDVSHEQRAATELIKRIRKLRWMGMEEEAHRLVRSTLRLYTSEAAVAAPSKAD